MGLWLVLGFGWGLGVTWGSGGLCVWFFCGVFLEGSFVCLFV